MAEQIPETASSWQAIVAFLGEKAPRIATGLRGGATELEIQAAEAALKLPFPEDVRQLYQLCNGGEESDLFPSLLSGDMGYSLLSLQEVVQLYRSLKASSEAADADDEVKPQEWNRKWIAIATNGAGDYQCVDLAPTKAGRAGQIIECRHETLERRLVAPSLAHRLAELAEGLAAGRYEYEEDLGIVSMASGRPAAFVSAPALPKAFRTPKKAEKASLNPLADRSMAAGSDVRPADPDAAPRPVAMTLGVDLHLGDAPDEQEKKLASAVMGALQQLLGSVATGVATEAHPSDPAVLCRLNGTIQDPRVWSSFVQWAATELPTAFPKATWGGGVSDLSGPTLVHTRWVALTCPTSDADEFYRYPEACGECHYFDFDQVPQSLAVNPLLTREEGDSEMFQLANGILVVSQRVFEALEQLVPEEITHGLVTVTGRPGMNGRYRWVRPKATTPRRFAELWSAPCERCGTPVVKPQTGHILESFGDPAANIARIGPYPAPGRVTTGPRHWQVVVSGGLYAALFNLGVKRLYWPQLSMQVLLSAKAGESPVEQHRRFDGLFHGKADKAWRQKGLF